ncbi:GNAT family N-acetyltransferase [Bifidobacterium moukalabense]|uniref:GNAT family N-acetyltransferase n=1 Tax=Bifidobacterium moukalabense TaxID=1333651 RepID=UPI0010F56914|nr:GNAT family protein [Bifidobacterium moukalabense]
MPENAESSTVGVESRELPARITIPPIRGEMVHLRPATVADLDRMDVIDAYPGASGITGKDRVAERAAVHAWVRRSVAWANGETSKESGVGDPESRRTVAWSIITESDHDGNGEIDAASSDNVIGMIFLIDIDGWARSARIQVILGQDFRGRGYSRDIMPRVMTYGFAPEPAGLGMHRIWVAVPEQNTRSVSVYQSLGFVPSGRSRDALWNASQNRYQDLIVMDTLVDEFDPIRSLDAFGMHVIEDNPGVKEALSAREHSIAIQINAQEEARAKADEQAGKKPGMTREEAYEHIGVKPGHVDAAEARVGERADETDSGKSVNGDADAENNWPYGSPERKTSKEAWWRTLGRGRKRDREGK